MCGILAIFGSTLPPNELRQLALSCSKTLRHRGPDWSGVVTSGNNAIVHERLSIVDPESGSQPLTNSDESIILSVNGEIYNHRELAKALQKPYKFKTHSDCEIVIPLFEAGGGEQADITAMLNQLRGMFAFVLFNKTTGRYFAARDHMGICPLYMGVGRDGGMWFSSELKALSQHCAKVEAVPPGHFYSSTNPGFTRWYNPTWREGGADASAAAAVCQPAVDLTKLREGFESSVVRRMMCDVPWGVLLSGGLDSSLVAAVASRHAQQMQGYPKLHSFTIGLKGSPDLEAAARVATYLDTVHHSYTFTVQQGIDALRDVIYHLETYDVTTVRASTPMFLMSRKIKAMGVKMVLSGEGADEVFGGYLYFHHAPSAQELHAETVDKLDALHLFDCLRANKSTAAWGVEARVPFLDRDFMDVGMGFDPKDKMIDREAGRIEKWALRAAFDTPDRPYLPSDILWRQKEQFSDGVGYSWIDSLRAHAADAVSDAQLAAAPHRFPLNTPHTKEAYLYRSIFEEHFPSETCQRTVPHASRSIACSTERALQWSDAFAAAADPSGRCIEGVHNQAYADAKAAAAGDATTTATATAAKQNGNHAAVSEAASKETSPHKRARHA